mgnify:CR=1 FL=1
MGERYDFCRAVTDGRHYFIRNFMPHRPRGRDSVYGYTVQANWRAWREWHDADPEAAGINSFTLMPRGTTGASSVFSGFGSELDESVRALWPERGRRLRRRRYRENSQARRQRA